MGCLPVRGDNPQALASGLSYVQLDKHGAIKATTAFNVSYSMFQKVNLKKRH